MHLVVQRSNIIAAAYSCVNGYSQSLRNSWGRFFIWPAASNSPRPVGFAYRAAKLAADHIKKRPEQDSANGRQLFSFTVISNASSSGMYCIKGGLHRLLHYIGCRFICGKVIISRGKETHMHRGMARWEAAMPPLIWFPDKQEAI